MAHVHFAHKTKGDKQKQDLENQACDCDLLREGRRTWHDVKAPGPLVVAWHSNVCLQSGCNKKGSDKAFFILLCLSEKVLYWRRALFWQK